MTSISSSIIHLPVNFLQSTSSTRRTMTFGSIDGAAFAKSGRFLKHPLDKMYVAHDIVAIGLL